MTAVVFLERGNTQPVRVFGGWGLAAFGSGFLIELVVIGLRLGWAVDMSGNPALYVGILLLILGTQLVMLGLLGEIMVRTHHQASGRPIYTLLETIPPGLLED